MSQGYSAWYEFHEAHILRDSGQAFWEKKQNKTKLYYKRKNEVD